MDLEVVGVVSDGHPTNVKAFKTLCKENVFWFQNPQKEDRKIFCMFDTVHLIKNVRNNLFNTDEQRFVFLDWDQYHAGGDDPDRIEANLNELRDYARSHYGDLIREGFRLNEDVLNPNVFQKQNMNLVENFFHDVTIAALKSAGMNGMAQFLQIFRNFWDIVNTKSKFRGRRLIKALATPILRAEVENETCEKMKFLREFKDWVETWGEEEFVGVSLTLETHTALVRTVECHLEFIKYSFETFSDLDFMLLGKLQTDPLEKKFAQYRRQHGSSYEIDTRQAQQAERKLRDAKLIRMAGNIQDAIDVPDIDVDDDDIPNLNLINGLEIPLGVEFPFEHLYVEEFPQDVDGTDDSFLNVAGYAAAAVSKK
jgi:hypothetical protein